MATVSPEREQAGTAVTGRAQRRPRGNHRLLNAILALVVIAAAILAVLLRSGASGAAPPATGAAAVVPADALAYVHVSTDPGRPAVQSGLKLFARLGAGGTDSSPIGAAVLARLAAIAGGGSSIDFATDIRPWLGKEAAFALLNTASSSAGSLIVLDVRNGVLARQFVRRAGAQSLGAYEGVQMLSYRSGTELAFLAHYLVLGQDASVRAAIDVVHGRSPSLQANRGYQRAAAGEPADRVIDAYASAAGVRRLLAPQHGVIGALGALLDAPGLTGTAISVSPAGAGARVRIHTALDPAAKLSGTDSDIAPSLLKAIPSGAPLVLDTTGLDQLAPRILGAGAAAGVAGRLGPLLARLGSALKAEGVSVPSILSLFDGESALAVVPAAGGGEPALALVARTSNEARTRQQLAALELPFEQLFPTPVSGPGQASLWVDRTIDGVTVHEFALAPGLQLDYGVFNGLVVVGTSLDAVGAIASHARSVADDPEFHAALAEAPQNTRSLLFLNFSQLLSLGEQTGLLQSSRFQTLRADLLRIRAIGLDSTTGEADTTAELFLQIP